MPSKPTMRVARSRLLLWASVLCSAALCESQASNPIGEVTIRLADLVQTYDGAPKTVSVITVPPNLPVTISYDGSSDAPSDTGSYTVIAEVNLPLVQVSAKNTLTIAPGITNVSPPIDGIYTQGQTLEFSVAYSGAVTVSTNDGVPSISLMIGENSRQAFYAAGSGTTVLRFSCPISSADEGVVAVGSISLNGGSILDSDGNDAPLTFVAPDTSGVIVQASTPITTVLPGILELQRSDAATVRVIVSGSPRINYVVQATDDLSSPSWQPVGAALTGEDGIGVLDVAMDAPARFYRTVVLTDSGGGPPR